MNAHIIREEGTKERKYSVQYEGIPGVIFKDFLRDAKGRVRRFKTRASALKAAHEEGHRVYGNDADFYNPYYADWTENELKNAIHSWYIGMHWRGAFSEVEELRVELRRRGLSDKGYHEEEPRASSN